MSICEVLLFIFNYKLRKDFNYVLRKSKLWSCFSKTKLVTTNTDTQKGLHYPRKAQRGNRKIIVDCFLSVNEETAVEKNF